MGALPKRKISKRRKGHRRAHLALSNPTLTKCDKCNSEKLPHHVCTVCGTYKGVQVIKAE